MKYRKKPVTIEAYQTDVDMDIPTLEGTMHASVGDYIITGVRGEQYPCKPDIFLETYEPAEGNSEPHLRAGRRGHAGPRITGDTSDGYHTFNELYHHRAVLFSVIVRDHQELAWKSKLHHDGTMYDGMFIVGIDTPNGQATYHYAIDPYWEMFDCKELERAPEWDGHSPDDSIERISTLGSFTVQATERTDKDSEKGSDGTAGNYIMADGRRFPIELDYGFLGLMPIAINVAGFRYLLEVPNEE